MFLKSQKFFLISGLTIFLLGSCSPGEESIFTEVLSPQEDRLLRISVAKPASLPGCEYCRRPFFVYMDLIDKRSNEIERVLSTRLENDGVPFSSENIVASWTGENIALICLRASSLPDRGYRLHVKGEISLVETDGC
ncbi:MAG: hypothetical protein VX986_01335 [Pseudomonadota bacterium]|nr:hypothetical protein [Pseudomonadota bacterium]